MKEVFVKWYGKLFFKQWIIGITQDSLKNIITDKRISKEIKWFKPKSLNSFYADPFLVLRNKEHLIILLEEFNFKEDYGKISQLTLNNKFEIVNTKLLLDTKTHLSYPFIFKENNNTYVFPESAQSGKLSCYQYNLIKKELCFLADIINLPLLDSTILKYNNKYWLFGTFGSNTSMYELNIYFSDHLLGPYFAHKLNPVKTGLNGIRAAGAFVEIDGVIYRPTQNCEKNYGDSITINKIINISENEFDEEELMIISMDRNRDKMHSIHTINEFNDVIIIDGQRWIFSPHRQLQKFIRDISKKYKFRKNQVSRKQPSK